MTESLDIPRFLDRRHELTQKGKPVTDTFLDDPPKKPRKAVLRLVVEYDRDKFDMTVVQELVGSAGLHGTVKVAKLTGLPTSTDLA